MMLAGDAGECSTAASESAGRCQLCPQIHVRRERVQALGATEERADREGGSRERIVDGWWSAQWAAWSPAAETGPTSLHGR